MSSGMLRTTSGNEPEKRLLLKSSSARRLRFANSLGTVPVNLLVLIWKSASSYSNPSSGTKVPERFAWFKSMPATTRMLGGSPLIGGEQNTPL
jgi:hypothetical protein